MSCTENPSIDCFDSKQVQPWTESSEFSSGAVGDENAVSYGRQLHEAHGLRTQLGNPIGWYSKALQLWTIVKNKDSGQVSALTWSLNACSYLTMLSYSYANRYPLSMYSEYPILAIQDSGQVSALTWSLNACSCASRLTTLWLSIMDGIVVTTLIVSFFLNASVAIAAHIYRPKIKTE
ncbi:unnamed protein product [Medioppia subpectinata]|uniref:Uncharacterized protein n=1 Tax=Medioppia subpectinata TaxID=1979941 RepID=A0A7R9PUU3_9ACAR|nr:unnamed protein product [Medioppia subpectinata]CAG2101599.1 unnamed protein product [Medioppia subpectinata]